MSRLAMAQALMQEEEWALAIEVLEKGATTEEELRTLSLLYRHQDLYDREQELLVAAPDTPYFDDRRRWYELPIFDRIVPRQRLHLPRDPAYTPSQEVLDQLCFVTAGGSDQPYLNLLIQWFESLQATRLYKDIPVYVLDCGLSDEDKEMLHKRFKPAAIKDPGWDVRIDTPEVVRVKHDGFKGCTARPFINKHFPGHRYYFWMDTDCWVQDERSIDQYIALALKQKVGVSAYLGDPLFQDSWWGRVHCKNNKVLPNEYIEFLQNKTVISGAAFCVDTTSGFFEEWQKAVIESANLLGFSWGNEELNLIYTINKYIGTFDVLPPWHQEILWWRSRGFTVEEGNVITSYLEKEICGIIHVTGDVETKKRVFLPTKNEGVLGSQYYRVWPWAHKQELKDQLLRGTVWES